MDKQNHNQINIIQGNMASHLPLSIFLEPAYHTTFSASHIMCEALAPYVRSINTTREDHPHKDRKAMKRCIFEYKTKITSVLL